MEDAALSTVLDLIGAQHEQGARPVLVGVAGGVAVGKSTIARTIADALETRSALRVSVVSSDGFLHPNAELARRGLTLRKGFPESFDDAAIRAFLDELLDGRTTSAPVHDHSTYDIADEPVPVHPGDVVVFEGVNALLFHERLTITVYVASDPEHMRSWFVERATDLRERARTEYSPFFDPWTDAPDDAFADMLEQAWMLVNLPNLIEAIEPTRSFADVVITKGRDHTITAVERTERSGGAR